MIRNIIFDFGGVLVDWNPHHFYDGYFGSRKKADWFLANVCTMEWNTQMDGGKPFAEGIAELQAQFPEWSREIQLYFHRWMDMMGDEIPGSRELIIRLKEKGYPVYGLTNWSSETFCQVRHVYPVFDLLDGMVVSGEEHLLKPGRAIFDRLLDKFGLQASECLFTDDNEANVDGARAAGLSAIRFTSAAQIEADLAALGVL